MPRPLTVSCFSKIQIGFTFLVPVHLGSPRKKAVTRLCVQLSATFTRVQQVCAKPHQLCCQYDNVRVCCCVLCCGAVAAECRAGYQSIFPANGALSSKPAACCSYCRMTGQTDGWKDGQTDWQTDTQLFNRPCSAYYVDSMNNTACILTLSTILQSSASNHSITSVELAP